MIYVKRKENSGPHHMINPLWCEQWKDLCRYFDAVEKENEHTYIAEDRIEPVHVAVVTWDGSMVRGHVLSLGGKGDDRWVQVDSEQGWFVVHPMWVYVDWGGPDGRGYPQSVIKWFKESDAEIDVKSFMLS